jgi:hypothetical protein
MSGIRRAGRASLARHEARASFPAHFQSSEFRGKICMVKSILNYRGMKSLRGVGRAKGLTAARSSGWILAQSKFWEELSRRGGRRHRTPIVHELINLPDLHLRTNDRGVGCVQGLVDRTAGMMAIRHQLTRRSHQVQRLVNEIRIDNFHLREAITPHNAILARSRPDCPRSFRADYFNQRPDCLYQKVKLLDEEFLNERGPCNLWSLAFHRLDLI